jgi:hypothetical protein
MSHFAQINENNIVINVLVVDNENIENLPFPNSEPVGVSFLKNLFGQNTNWVQTSYNNNFRIRYAGIGYTYDVEKDAFISPKPYNSWILNNETLLWEPPVSQPTDGKKYTWFEPNKEWVELNATN